MTFEIFHDLDGVHADFHAHFFHISGISISEVPKKDLWKIIGKNKTFFYDLPIFPGSQELWEFCTTSFKKNRVLTGAPSSTVSRLQKRHWVAKYFGSHIHVDVVARRDKQTFAHAKGILIDDTEANIVEWIAAGGIGIHHIGSDFQRTINKLKKYL